jgi:hypothetical protein
MGVACLTEHDPLVPKAFISSFIPPATFPLSGVEAGPDPAGAYLKRKKRIKSGKSTGFIEITQRIR